MKLTYRQAVEAKTALNVIEGQELPLRTRIVICRFLNLLDAELRIYSKELRRVMDTYKITSETQDKGVFFLSSISGDNAEDTKKLKLEALKKYNNEFQTLLNTETPDWDIETIPLPEEVGNKLSPEHLRAIADFVEVI